MTIALAVTILSNLQPNLENQMKLDFFPHKTCKLYSSEKELALIDHGIVDRWVSYRITQTDTNILVFYLKAIQLKSGKLVFKR